jgi:hypothetical protein
MIIQDDPDVLDWANGVSNVTSGAGDFLRAVAYAALRADWENYPILRPALLQLVEKYPAYLEEERARDLRP